MDSRCGGRKQSNLRGKEQTVTRFTNRLRQFNNRSFLFKQFKNGLFLSALILFSG